MLGAKTIGCINHPGVESIGRCRQCSKPVCKACGIRGTGGVYCSEVCREKHEQFMNRARDLDLSRSSRKNWSTKIRNLLGGLITLAAILFAIGFAATIMYIPVLSDVTHTVREIIGF